MTNIDGTCDDRFAKVRAAFADNFSERSDVGAAVAVTHNGRPVVDLWGVLPAKIRDETHHLSAR